MNRLLLLTVAALLLALSPVALAQERQRAPDPGAAAPGRYHDPLAADTTLYGHRVGPPAGLSPLGFLGQDGQGRFGTSSATLDLNGDGYDDVIIGAPAAAGGGRVYAYFGGLAVSPVPDLTMTGEAVGDDFGFSVASAGDLNGDGYDDVIIGARGNAAGGLNNAGRAYVFFGGPALAGPLGATDADVILNGATSNDSFGWSVSGAGDVNGDGYPDLLVGASGANGGAGAAFVFFVGPALAGTLSATDADVTLNGAASIDLFGASVASAGDVNGDGYPDLLIGAPYRNLQGFEDGTAYVFFGGPALAGTLSATGADVTLTGAASGDFFGWSVSAAGDVNGDGLADLLVGAPYNDDGAVSAGAAYVFFGGLGLIGTLTAGDAAATLVGEATGDFFGGAILGLGDVTGDGVDDIAIGAAENDVFGAQAGRAYVFAGGPGLVGNVPPTAALARVGGAAEDFLGWSFSAGDLNGDGLPELVTGALGYENERGRAAVFSFGMTGTDLPDEVVYGSVAGERFGRFVAVGDLNGDGYTDLARGDELDDTAGTDAGRVRIYFGGPGAGSGDGSMDYVHDFEVRGTAAGDQFGSVVAGAGDLNGDGIGDLIVNQGGTGFGQVFVFFGDTALGGTVGAGSADAIIATGRGVTISGAGDVDGDGYDDLLIGIPFAGGGEGVFYIFLGGSGLSGTLSFLDADYREEGTSSVTELGRTVDGLGDVNGDGYADLGIGWMTSSPRQEQYFVYFGSPNVTEPNGLHVPVRLLPLSPDHGFLPNLPLAAGDVNGDGYADLAAAVADFTPPSSARVHVYFGGPAFDAAPGLTLTQLGPGATYIEALRLSDVNGDGYDDVGYVYQDNDFVDKGFVFFGGSDPDGLHDLTLWFTGAAADNVAATLTMPGDLDGDGYPELLVGDTRDDTNGTDAGALYVFEQSHPSVVPHIVSVRDVPNDQGGFVTVAWTRSGYDAAGSDRIVAYVLERSLPPGAGGFVWEHVTTVPATRSPRYAYAAPTFGAASGSNPGTTYFRVTAVGTGTGESWRSATASGASIDNLAPEQPESAGAGMSGDGDLVLSWTPNTTDPDVFGYAVYEAAAEGAEGGPEGGAPACGPDAGSTPVGTAAGAETNTYEVDGTPFGTDASFCLTTLDVHGNESAPTAPVSANPTVFAALKVILAGAYEAGLPGGALMRADLEDTLPLEQPYGGAPWGHAGSEAIPTTDTDANGRPDLLDAYAVVDWVLVCIRTTAMGAQACAAALLLADGTLLDPATESAAARVGPAEAGSYHVAVYHRNHAAAMTAFPLGLTSEVGAPYNLTLDPSNVYGGAGAEQPLTGGRYGLWPGDGTADGLVTAPDFNAWSAATAAGTTGYVASDFNLDGLVTAPDFNRWSAATAAGGQTAVPSPGEGTRRPAVAASPTPAAREGSPQRRSR